MLTKIRSLAIPLLLAIVACFPAHAQQWPTKPIRLIVPYPPGGGNDNLARLFGQKLGERLGQRWSSTIGRAREPLSAPIWRPKHRATVTRCCFRR